MTAQDAFLMLVNTTPWFFYSLVAFVSLCIGSFLNVVIYRLPKMLHIQWRNDCHSYLNPTDPVAAQEVFDLNKPRSHCPTCKTQIKWYQNIPVISWVVLRGKCASCKAPVSIRYPLIELLTMVLSLAVAYKFGVSWAMVLGLVFTWCLVALTFIDFAEQILPDRIVFPLIGLGLLASTYGIFVNPSASIWGAVIGFLCLWIVYVIFKKITGKEGMGYGDFKLLCATGAWFGAFSLPTVILVSSLLGTVIGLFLLVRKNQNKPFAFGPYIAIAAWVYLMFGSIV